MRHCFSEHWRRLGLEGRFIVSVTRRSKLLSRKQAASQVCKRMFHRYVGRSDSVTDSNRPVGTRMHGGVAGVGG